MKARAVASAPAKVIHLGEHFGVHGGPAILLAIDKRATVKAKPRTDKKICIQSNAIKASGHFLDNRFYAGEDREAFIARKTMDGVRIEG